MAERVARRAEVLSLVTTALTTDTAVSREARLRPLGVPAAALRALPQALDDTPEVVVRAGEHRLVACPVRVAGWAPDYRPPPRLGEHGGAVARSTAPHGRPLRNPASADAPRGGKVNHCPTGNGWEFREKGPCVDDGERQVWELAVELGLPDSTGASSFGGAGIPPIALALEESVHRVRGRNRIPCFTAFGAIAEIAEFAERAWRDTYRHESVPVACRLAVYVTDEELDELAEVVVADLGLTEGGYSVVTGRKVTIRLRPISLQDPDNRFYRSLVEQYMEQGRTA